MNKRSKWKASHKCCMICGWSDNLPWPHPGWLPRLEAHEIIGGGLRDLSLKTLALQLVVCQYCHQEVIPTMRHRDGVAYQLAIKLLRDPTHFSLSEANKVASLRYVPFTDLEIIKLAKAISLESLA
jgi:hypothetical protein